MGALEASTGLLLATDLFQVRVVNRRVQQRIRSSLCKINNPKQRYEVTITDTILVILLLTGFRDGSTLVLGHATQNLSPDLHLVNFLLQLISSNRHLAFLF